MKIKRKPKLLFRKSLSNEVPLFTLKNHDKTIDRLNEYIIKKIKTDSHFCSKNDTRRRIHDVLKDESKSSSTMDIIDIQT